MSNNFGRHFAQCKNGKHTSYTPTYALLLIAKAKNAHLLHKGSFHRTCLTGQDSAEPFNFLLLFIATRCLIQTDQIGDQPYSDTFPQAVSEYSLARLANPGLFFVYFCYFQTSNIFLQQINVKKCSNVHPVYGAGIRTHDLSNITTRPGLRPCVETLTANSLTFE